MDKGISTRGRGAFEFCKSNSCILDMTLIGFHFLLVLLVDNIYEFS
jgi:hypothetical protein